MTLPTPKPLNEKNITLDRLRNMRKYRQKCIGVDLSEYTYDKGGISFLEYLLIEIFLVLAGADALESQVGCIVRKIILRVRIDG